MAITGAIVYFLSQAIQMSIFVTNIASMLGIGVAVDYSLFVLARYREEIKAGDPEDEARTVAMRTSGLAVAFSGVTVIIALAGLFLIDSKIVRSMAIGAIVVVGDRGPRRRDPAAGADRHARPPGVRARQGRRQGRAPSSAASRSPRPCRSGRAGRTA